MRNQKIYGILFDQQLMILQLKSTFSDNLNMLKKVFYLLFTFAIFLTSCNWFKTTPEVGLILSRHFSNQLYKKFDTAAYNVVFNRHFDSLQVQLNSAKVLGAYYADASKRTGLVSRFYTTGELDTLNRYISRSEEHGFSSKTFQTAQLEKVLSALSANKFKSIEEVYPVIAELELYSASALLKYNTFVGYGSIVPRNVLNRYYVKTLRPDSLAKRKVLETDNLPQFLTALQPVNGNYKILQQELFRLKKNPDQHASAIKTIEVNMERLRWKIPDLSEEYVEVNIPDFSLTWFNREDTVSHMKVCVGARREKDYEEKMKVFQKTRSLDDKPKNHQTPVLLSTFSSIQVNPIWNIPVSIAQNEIYYQAMRDPYYLSNNNMKVYHKGKLVADPDTIQWKNYSRGNLPFQFKQGSGEGNALGKFKFVFDNGSSIYLHDTNNKAAFARANRALSHGCIRVERPLEFAEKLVDNKSKYDQLRMEVNLPPVDTGKMELFRKLQAKKTDTSTIYQMKPKWFGTKKNVSIFINYKTAWAQNGSITYRNDIYNLDDAIYAAMKNFR